MVETSENTAALDSGKKPTQGSPTRIGSTEEISDLVRSLCTQFMTWLLGLEENKLVAICVCTAIIISWPAWISLSIL